MRRKIAVLDTTALTLCINKVLYFLFIYLFIYKLRTNVK